MSSETLRAASSNEPVPPADTMVCDDTLSTSQESTMKDISTASEPASQEKRDIELNKDYQSSGGSKKRKRSETELELKPIAPDSEYPFQYDSDPYTIVVDGLDSSAGESDVKKLFQNLDIDHKNGGIYARPNHRGLHSGKAYVRFTNQADFLASKEFNGRRYGRHYLEIFSVASAKELSNFKQQSYRLDDLLVPSEERADLTGNQCKVVRIRGFSWKTNKQTLREFFHPLEVVGGDKGVLLVCNSKGQLTGEAYLEFMTEMDGARARTRDRGNLGRRWIEVYCSSLLELEQAKDRAAYLQKVIHEQRKAREKAFLEANQDRVRTKVENDQNDNDKDNKGNSSPDTHPKNNVQNDTAPLAKQAELKKEYFHRLQYVPVVATEDDINRFFKDITIGRVYFIIGQNGQRNNEAFVEFLSEYDWIRAEEFNKTLFGTAYHGCVEIFKSSRDEVEKRIGSLDGNQKISGVVASARQCGLKMRGFPWSTTDSEIREWFVNGAHVRPLYIHRKQSDEEALLEFKSEKAAKSALKLDHEQMGDRYIQLFPMTQAQIWAIVGPPPKDVGRGRSKRPRRHDDNKHRNMPRQSFHYQQRRHGGHANDHPFHNRPDSHYPYLPSSQHHENVHHYRQEQFQNPYTRYPTQRTSLPYHHHHKYGDQPQNPLYGHYQQQYPPSSIPAQYSYPDTNHQY